MESATASNSNLKTKNDFEEDANSSSSSSSFRRRRNTIIFIFTFFFISLALIIGSLIIYLIRDSTASQYERHSTNYITTSFENPAIQTFNSAANCYTDSCFETFDRLIGTKTITNPNQILILALQASARDLQNTTELASKNCSNSMRDSLSRIGDALAIMRVNPFVEKLSDEKNGEMVDRISPVEDILMLCVDDLEKVVEKSTAVINEVRAKVLQVVAYVTSSEAFLMNYKEVLQNNISVDWGYMFADNLFIICVCVFADNLFIIFLFWSVFSSR